MSPFHYFLYITNPLLSSFILSVDPLPRVIKRDEPKGSHTLAYFISDPSIVLQVCAPILKDFIPYYTLLVVQRHSLYLRSLAVPESIVLCILFLSNRVPPPPSRVDPSYAIEECRTVRFQRGPLLSYLSPSHGPVQNFSYSDSWSIAFARRDS